jgi:ferrous iron transport protein A
MRNDLGAAVSRLIAKARFKLDFRGSGRGTRCALDRLTMKLNELAPPVSCDNCRTCCLSGLTNGCCGSVVGISGDRELRRRLLEMGFCHGTRVEFVRRAPFGDPIEFRLRGYCVSLRGEQARNITVRIAG